MCLCGTKAKKLPVLASRAFSSSARQLKNKVPEAQKLFQEDNGLPVHIKGGTGDMMLYRATMTLTIAGTCYSLYWLLMASMPQKKA
ncbi:cytochrome c oxidase subunit 7A2, mitochondrial isoform X1 [Dicentrarchus labrax]|uniref:cytochrome c oxidase subunit 7A2, mitochondrial isoform X1 n=1 Tax=Dicentrarchus labrax TaxID=13489 RepID=UPI0021F6363E|nr:cytochrome c oxidase subunit 7A2, mitochondrial isoform X1 [Dicentrarchus labrax]